jgi:hypothetical protein
MEWDMSKGYQYKPGYFGPKKVPAEVLATELAKLEEKGPLTAKRVVDAARPVKSPLHPELEWDDKIAGEAYRVGQARTWIRAIEIVIEPKEPEEPRVIVPAYVHVPSGKHHEEGTYVTPLNLIESPSQYARALEEALRHLESSEKAVHFLRRLAEGRGEGIEAQLSTIHEAFHLIRDALEALKAA